MMMRPSGPLMCVKYLAFHLSQRHLWRTQPAESEEERTSCAQDGPSLLLWTLRREEVDWETYKVVRYPKARCDVLQTSSLLLIPLPLSNGRIFGPMERSSACSASAETAATKKSGGRARLMWLGKNKIQISLTGVRAKVSPKETREAKICQAKRKIHVWRG